MLLVVLVVLLVVVLLMVNLDQFLDNDLLDLNNLLNDWLDMELLGVLNDDLLNHDLLDLFSDNLSLLLDLDDNLLWSVLDNLLENDLELMDLVLDNEDLLLGDLDLLYPLLSVVLLALVDISLENCLLDDLDFELLDNL